MGLLSLGRKFWRDWSRGGVGSVRTSDRGSASPEKVAGSDTDATEERTLRVEGEESEETESSFLFVRNRGTRGTVNSVS